MLADSWILCCTTCQDNMIISNPILSPFLHDPDCPNVLIVFWRSSSPMLKSSGAPQTEQQSWRPWEFCHGEKSFFNSEGLQLPLGCQLKNVQWPIIIQIEHFMTYGLQRVSRVSLYTFSCNTMYASGIMSLLNVQQHQRRLIPTTSNRLRKSLSR